MRGSRGSIVGPVASICFGLLLAPSVLADINLGMKLSAKKYAEAWNSGNRHAVYGHMTGDFAATFDRLPDDLWAMLPRGGQGSILSSSKSGHRGYLTVSSSQGTITLVMVGSGFDWRVADIIKPGDDGRSISTKAYLDAKLTAREFMVDLRERGGQTFYDSITPEFRSAFSELDGHQLARIRRMLPPVDSKVPSRLLVNGSHATLTATPPGGNANDRVVFSLVHNGKWTIADYTVNAAKTKIPSMRAALPVIACAMAFERFVADPQSVDPAEFIAKGMLQDTFRDIQLEGKFPFSKTSDVIETVVARDARSVTIRYPARTVKLVLSPQACGLRICKIEATMAGNYLDVGTMLAVRSKARNSGIAGLFGRVQGAVGSGTPTSLTAVAATSAIPANVTRSPGSVNAQGMTSNDRDRVAMSSFVAKVPVPFPFPLGSAPEGTVPPRPNPGLPSAKSTIALTRPMGKPEIDPLAIALARAALMASASATVPHRPELEPTMAAANDIDKPKVAGLGEIYEIGNSTVAGASSEASALTTPSRVAATPVAPVAVASSSVKPQPSTSPMRQRQTQGVIQVGYLPVTTPRAVVQVPPQPMKRGFNPFRRRP